MQDRATTRDECDATMSDSKPKKKSAAEPSLGDQSSVTSPVAAQLGESDARDPHDANTAHRDSPASEPPASEVSGSEQALSDGLSADAAKSENAAAGENAATVEGEEYEFGYRRAAAKVKEFPQSPGVYLMKDAAGRVIYVGKAKNLRSRAGSYFHAAAEEEYRTKWVREICDIDFVECERDRKSTRLNSSH